MSKNDKSKSQSFLNKMDKMLTGTSKKKVPNKECSGNLPRPNSDLDLNEMEEDQYYLDNLADEEVRERFQNMIKDMNIANETVMMNTPVDKMRIMLENNYKMAQTQHKLDSPKEYIKYLRWDDLSPKAYVKTLETLQVALRSNKITWLQEFAHNGLRVLLSILNECYRKSPKAAGASANTSVSSSKALVASSKKAIVSSPGPPSSPPCSPTNTNNEKPVDIVVEGLDEERRDLIERLVWTIGGTTYRIPHLVKLKTCSDSGTEHQTNGSK